MRIEKEEENSCFRSTDTAQCAEKGKFSSSFSMMKIHFATEIVFGDSSILSLPCCRHTNSTKKRWGYFQILTHYDSLDP